PVSTRGRAPGGGGGGGGAGAAADGAVALLETFGDSAPSPLPSPGVGEGDDVTASPSVFSWPSTSTRAMTAPSETSSPTLSFISFTVPANGDGTSIVALSDSSVIRLCSFSTLSPALTSTSMTGTPSWPMSGT